MNLLKPSNIEEIVIYLLKDGPKTTTTLLSELQQRRKNTTKQAFYVVLRKLKTEEIILIYSKKVALNTAWIKDTYSFIEGIISSYTLKVDSFDILSLGEKESVSYLFSTTKHLDTFWGHSQNILLHNTESEPIYSYDPHYWFYIARKESEQKLLESITENQRQFLMTVGGNTPLDKIIKQDFNNDYLQYTFNEPFEKKNYYVTVIGNYITEVTLDPLISDKIEELYRSNTIPNQTLMDEFNKILNSKARNKIKISRNYSKAQKLKNKLSKNFFIKNDSKL